jgi:hypothetical protein
VKSTLCLSLAAISAAAVVAFAGNGDIDESSSLAKYSEVECEVLHTLLIHVADAWNSPDAGEPRSHFLKLAVKDSTRDGGILCCANDGVAGHLPPEEREFIPWSISHIRETVKSYFPDASDEIIDDFYAKNQARWPLPDSATLESPYPLLGKEECKQFSDYVPTLDDLDLDDFGARAIAEISRVGFNNDKTLAIVYGGVHIGWLAGRGTLYFLIKTDDGWKLKNHAWIWVV